MHSSNLTVIGKYIQSCMPRMGTWFWRWKKVRYLVTQLCMHNVCYKLESSQTQNCNILTQLSGIRKVLCPTFYLPTHTCSTVSVRCATELAVTVCTRVVICSSTGEGRQKTWLQLRLNRRPMLEWACVKWQNFSELDACCSCPETAISSINQVEWISQWKLTALAHVYRSSVLEAGTSKHIKKHENHSTLVVYFCSHTFTPFTRTIYLFAFKSAFKSVS